MSDNIVIGIAGGSGSGKTTVAGMIVEDFGENQVTVVLQDRYYQDLKHIPAEQRAQHNFDHPNAIDATLMAEHVRALKQGRPVEAPVYDFVTHTRRPETLTVQPRPIIIVEGILVLECEEVRNLMDVKIYVDTDDDIRFIRRLKRDIVERGRSIESVINQYLKTVRPMHLEFVEKSKRDADLILPWRDMNTAAVGMMINMLRGFLLERTEAAELERIAELERTAELNRTADPL